MTDSRIVTFRIDEQVMSIVEQESQRLHINLNNMTNQILKRYVDWDMLQARAGMIPIAKPLLVELLNKVSDEEIASLANNVGKNTMTDIISFMRNRLDLDSFLTWLELWLRKNSTSGYTHTVDESTNVHTYIMKHDLGEKWSLYLKIILDLIFKEILKKPLINLTSSNMLITFSFIVMYWLSISSSSASCYKHSTFKIIVHKYKPTSIVDTLTCQRSII